MLAVTTAATDPTLLTLAEVAEAVGKPANTSGLAALNARVSGLIAGACGLERAGASVLTLRDETLTETLRLKCPVDVLRLSRKPVLEIISVTEGDDELTVDTDFEIEGPRNLRRIQSGGLSSWWSSGKIVISYRAGWATVPPELKELAAKLAVVLHAERGRDPSLGSIDIPGVISETYRYGRPDDPLIPAEITEGLKNGGFLMHEMVY